MIRLSPTEEQVLALLGEQWHTSMELKRKLFPHHTPEAVNSALTYLRRHELAQKLERRGEPFYEQTPLGAEFLADLRRSRTPMDFEGLHVA